MFFLSFINTSFVSDKKKKQKKTTSGELIYFLLEKTETGLGHQKLIHL